MNDGGRLEVKKLSWSYTDIFSRFRSAGTEIPRYGNASISGKTETIFSDNIGSRLAQHKRSSTHAVLRNLCNSDVQGGCGLVGSSISEVRTLFAQSRLGTRGEDCGGRGSVLCVGSAMCMFASRYFEYPKTKQCEVRQVLHAIPLAIVLRILQAPASAYQTQVSDAARTLFSDVKRTSCFAVVLVKAIPVSLRLLLVYLYDEDRSYNPHVSFLLSFSGPYGPDSAYGILSVEYCITS